MPATHSRLTRLPEELLSHILHLSVYREGDFAFSVEYNEIAKPGSPFSMVQAWLAQDGVLVDKPFYRIGQEVLWRFVVIRSMEGLLSVARQARGGAGTATWRLQTRICGEYRPDVVANLLDAMPNLKIFVLNNQPIPHGDPFLADLRHVVAALTPLKKLKRIHFDSPGQHPTICQLRDLLNAQSQAVSLRTASITASESRQETLEGWPPQDVQSLKEVSVGFMESEYRGEPLSAALNLLLTLLVEASPTQFPKLTFAHLLDFGSVVPRFLHAYGHQLRQLLYSTPTSLQPSSEEVNFLDLCPKLRSLIWVVSHWESVDDRHSIPKEHKRVRLVTIVYPDEMEQSPNAYSDLREVLSRLDSGRFPKLRRVQLKAGVGNGVDIQKMKWFRAHQRSLSRANVQVVILPPVE